MARYGRGASTSRGSLVTEQNQQVPQQVPNLSAITQISAGIGHVLALASDRTVWARGTNDKGVGEPRSHGTPQGGATTTSDNWVRATNSRACLLARAVAATGTRGGATAAGRRLVLAIL